MTIEFKIKNCKDHRTKLKGLVKDAKQGSTFNSVDYFQKHLEILEKEYKRWKEEYPEFFI